MSEFNFSIPGGASKRLKTGGKYCPDDIIVTAESGGVELPELSSPGGAADLMEGKQLIDADGKVVDGAFTLKEELTEQDALIEQLKATLAGKAGGLPTQEKSLEITENGTGDILPDAGYTLSRVGITVNVPIPDGYVKPSGTLEVTENGTYDASGYQSVNVNVEVLSEPDPRDQYQRVENITSDGSAYIITDFIADNESGMELVASFPQLEDRPPMGSRADTGATRFYCVYPMSASSFYFGFNNGSTISVKPSADKVYRLQTNFMDCRMVNIFDADGTRAGGTAISQTLAQQNKPIAIFGYYHGGTDTINSVREFTLYGARISDGNDIIREYIPCYRKSDGVVGLFEKFTGQFLTNANPDGTAFAKGADIDW